MNKIRFEIKNKEELQCLINAIDNAMLTDKQVLHDLHENLKDMVK